MLSALKAPSKTSQRLPHPLTCPSTSSSRGPCCRNAAVVSARSRVERLRKTTCGHPTITAEHEPHFGGLLSHSRRLLNQSWLSVSVASLCFQSCNPKAPSAVQSVLGACSALQIFPSCMAAKGRLALDSKQNSVYTYFKLLSERESRKNPRLEIASVSVDAAFLSPLQPALFN